MVEKGEQSKPHIDELIAKNLFVFVYVHLYVEFDSVATFTIMNL